MSPKFDIKRAGVTLGALVLGALLSGAALPVGAARAETIFEALALAYEGNPAINAQRANVRATDENEPLAKSGLRPTIAATADAGYQHIVSRTPPGPERNLDLNPRGFGISISQPLFDGFKTQNNIEAARAGIYAAREQLRNVEQNTLFDAASAYMNVIRDRAVLDYRQQALSFLDELVRSERARFEVGESTRTDVAQAEAQQAAARSQVAAAQAQLQGDIAIYRQVVGREPGRLNGSTSIARLIPGDIDRAVAIGLADHPAILATKYLVDQADWQVKSAESDLLPRVGLEASSQRRYEGGAPGQVTTTNSISAQLTVPIYQGGRVSAQVRQNKERLGQAWIEVDRIVDQVRAAIASAYAQRLAAQASIDAFEAQQRAADLALQGSIEERKVGQRTTLDVLRAQQDVLNAQLSLANAQRDVVVAGFAIVSAIGRLDARRLGLAVDHYEPVEHYVAVKDKWYGLRTPDGR